MMSDERPVILGDFLARAAAESPAETRMLERENARTSGPTTYRDFERDVRALALALRTREFSFGRLSAGDRVAVFLDNCREWLLVDQALAYAGLVSVPRGTDSTESELIRIVEHSESKLVFRCAGLTLGLPDSSTVDSVVVGGGGAKGDSDADAAGPPKLASLLAQGIDALDSAEGAQTLAAARPLPTDLCTIVYTSGTTGEPKGVMLTHANIVSNVHGVIDTLDYPAFGTMLSILPSWHMFERVFEYVSIARSCTIVYTDTRRVAEDLKTFRPHIVAFVPRIWERFASTLQKRLAALPKTKAFLVRQVRRLGSRAQRAGSSRLTRRLHLALARRVLAPVHASLGGRLQLAASGGGALPAEVDRLMLELGLPLLNGYGLTETSPVLALRRPEGNRIGSIGAPMPHTEMRIVKDGCQVGVGEVGEIVARGPQVMRGYYKNEEATRAVLDDEGWFRTGDLGVCDASGWYSITGRIKDTIVLKGGENVEPEPIECRLKTSPWIEQVMVVGQDQKILGALLVLDEEHYKTEKGTKANEDADLRKTIRGELDRLLTSDAGFRKIDRVGPFVLLDEAFTQEAGTMTATLKLRRHIIQDRHKGAIAQLFA